MRKNKKEEKPSSCSSNKKEREFVIVYKTDDGEYEEKWDHKSVAFSEDIFECVEMSSFSGVEF